jgi:hypothetical protein
MAYGNGGRRHDVSLPYDAKRVPALGGDDTQPTDRRLGTASEDRKCLPVIPVTPDFDTPEAAVKKGGRGG